MELEECMQNMVDQNLDGMVPTAIVAEVVGIVAVILVTVWVGHYHGGFAWSSFPALEFNWHPVLMTIGLIFLYAHSILVYRVLRNIRKKNLKLIHMVLHVVSFIVVVIGLVAVFDSHNLAVPPTPNLYSLHSWVGLTAVILFSCQWVAGFVVFLVPGLDSSLRASYLPVHVFFGLGGFVLAVVSALLGIGEKAIWAIKNLSDLPPEGMLVNFIGVLLIVFAGLVVYLVSEVRFKRVAHPEDEHLLNPTGNN